MADQVIIHMAISLVEIFDGNKNKFEAWIISFENAKQISCQNILWIAFSKIIGAPLTSAHRLRGGTPNITWKELKSKLSMQYYNSTWQSHDSGYHLFTTRPRWAAHNVFTLCKWALIKNPPHFRYVSHLSGGSKPLHCGVWPELKKVDGNCCGTLDCPMEIYWRLLQKYLCIWCGLQKS